MCIFTGCQEFPFSYFFFLTCV
uniref:Uncharacterized protein n=1 Tax=Rhizophora mucronata TaxID=61149 RepID=A0A2P2PAD8_RHIMU